MTSTSDLLCADLSDRRAVLRVAGPDARDFLQGLVSNDVALLAPDRALHAALLTPQGKYLFDFLLLDAGDGAVLLDAERARLGELRQRLLMYRLRAKVTVEEPEGPAAVLAMLSEDAPARLGLPAAAGAARSEGGGFLAVDPRLAALGVRAVLPAAEVAAFAGRHGLALAGPDAWDRHRLALGVADGSADLVPQKAILLESGFDELGGVSFTKGCFVGQELTARTKHRGLVKKRLLPVAVEGPLPAPGTVIELPDGREAGEMRTGLDGRGLALLRLEWAVPAARGEVELRAGASRLRPELPGWVVLPGA